MVLESFASSILLSIGLMSWQDSLSVSGAARSTRLRSTSIASSMSVSFLKSNVKGEYGLASQLFLGKAQVANSKTATGGDLEYAASGVDVWGVALTPQYSLSLAEGVFIGVGVPVVLRHASLPTVSGAAYTVGPRLKFMAGINLLTRIERGDFFVGQRVGFLQLPNSLSWGVEMGWRF